jgi:two-component system, NarL family, nitrate/nitrite response regulator NarL
MAAALAPLDLISQVRTVCAADAARLRASGFAPDAVVVDLLGGEDLAFLAEAMRVWPDARFVAIALVEAQADMLLCVRLGVHGLVTRDQSLNEMMSILIAAMRGEYCWSNRVTAALIRHIERGGALPVFAEKLSPRPGKAPESVFSREPPAPAPDQGEERTEQIASECNLTARQQEVLTHLGEGLSNKEIARKLDIELPTVKHHVHEVLRKLGVQRRTTAIARLRREGWSGAEAEASK